MNYVRTCVSLQCRTIRYATVPLPLHSHSAPHTSLQAQPQAAAGTCHYKFLSGRHSRPTINLQRQASVKAQGLLSAQPPSGPVPPFILVWLRPNPSGMRPKSVPKTSQKCPKSVPKASQLCLQLSHSAFYETVCNCVRKSVMSRSLPLLRGYSLGAMPDLLLSAV